MRAPKPIAAPAALALPLLLALAACLAFGCSDDRSGSATDATSAAPEAEATATSGGAAKPSSDRLVTYTEERAPCADYTPTRMPLFGDVHVHTSFSFDAAANTTGATPVDANRYARGEPIPFWPLDEEGRAAGRFAIDRPLDFLAVTDHGEFLGERRLCRTPGSPSYDTPYCETYRSDQRQGMAMLGAVITTETPARVAEICGEDGALCREWASEPWRRIIDAAEGAYDRSAACRFTSFVAYEYTGTPGTSNYHRNVLFRTNVVPDGPVSYVDAPIDSLLWKGLDAVCDRAEGCDYLTIPHNSNLANGRMGPYRGIEQTADARRAYAEKREDREPIMEIFQHKGGSECINGLSSILAEPDELCDLEQVRTIGRMKSRVTIDRLPDGSVEMGRVTEKIEECAEGAVGEYGMVGAGCVDETDFIRSNLLVGLEEAAELGANPVKLGMIGSTDTHAATPGAVLENDWRGHVTGESTPAERLEQGLLTSNIDGNPGGLAGVWAVENSRDAIFEAMQRREVFGTSGPRITPRFFAGWNLAADLCAAPDMVKRGYAEGVPMGGDLAGAPADAKPGFLLSAARDPQGGRLERLQLVKGWIDTEGRRHAKVLDVAGEVDPEAGVDLATAKPTGDAGHDTLCTVYRDEDFDPALPAYYYLRVVEEPSARWSVHDCLRLPEAERPAACTDSPYPPVIREMAWTSPVWYQP